MADTFMPNAIEPAPRSFMPTLLVAALDAARREAEAAPPPPPAPPIEPLLATARHEGFADGVAEGLRRAGESREAVAARALEGAAEALRLGHDAAREAAEVVAQDLARLVLSMLDAALPGLAGEHGAPLAVSFASRVAPVLETVPEAQLLVPAGLGDAVRALLGASTITVGEDAGLMPGDARATWRGGGATLDLAARRREIRRVLESSGLGPKE